MARQKSQSFPWVFQRLFDCYVHLKGYWLCRVILVTMSFTTVIDIVTDYLALYSFSKEGHKWWSGICLGALYFSNRLGFYRWARANYRLRDFRMFARMKEMKLDWTLLVHSIPLLGPLIDMFYLHHGGWEDRASNILVALWLCIEVEIILSCFSWFYLIIVINEICQLIPEYWNNLKFNPNALPPANLIVIPALELFEAVPQILIQFRAYFDPAFGMNDQIFFLSAVFSIIGILKALFTFVYHYPRMRLKQGVFKVCAELDFCRRQFTEFPAVDGDFKNVKTLYLGENPGFDAFSIPPIPSLQCLRLNSCNITTLTPPKHNIISLAHVSKVAGDSAIGFSDPDQCYSKRFPMLKYLDLSGNVGFDSDSIPAMPFLSTLSLSNCDLVTLGKKSWTKRFPRLELLELNNNPRLSSLVKLKSIRLTNMTLLELDKEQTILPGFQVENYGEPEVIENYETDRDTNFSHLVGETVVPFRLKL